jgi:hypothetical protein
MAGLASWNHLKDGLRSNSVRATFTSSDERTIKIKIPSSYIASRTLPAINSCLPE